MPTVAAAAPVQAERSSSIGQPASWLVRLRPAVVMLAIYWAFCGFANVTEMTMLARFLSRMLVHLALLAGLLGWWLLQRGVPWRDRWLTVALFVLGSAGMLAISDPSIGLLAVLLMVGPWVLTAAVVWLWWSRGQPVALQRGVMWGLILLMLAVLPLLRFNGIDGKQHEELSWRWQPTAEQLFLASHTPKLEQAESAADAASTGGWTLQAGDAPDFRGPHRDGVASGERLALDWSAHAPAKLWRQRIGPAWSSLIVVDGHVVTQEQRDDAEVVACYQAATGKEVWVHADPVRFHESLSGAGPRGTPTFADGRLYALGGKGNLNCLEAATGKVGWSHDLAAEAKAAVPQWGFAVSPLVVDGKVIVFAPGKDAAGLIAYDAATGELRWQLKTEGDTYSSPQLVELAGVRQVVMHDSHGLRGVALDDGKPLWELASGSEMSVPMLQPRAVGATKLLASLEAGLTLLSVERKGGSWTTNEVWTSNRIKPNFNDVVTHQGKVYGLDDGILCALDLETGERLWKKGRYGHGQLLLLADRDALVVQGARGEVVLVGIGGDAPEELGRFAAIEGKTWNHPVLVANRLFVRNGEEIACYELPRAN